MVTFAFLSHLLLHLRPFFTIIFADAIGLCYFSYRFLVLAFMNLKLLGFLARISLSKLP